MKTHIKPKYFYLLPIAIFLTGCASLGAIPDQRMHFDEIANMRVDCGIKDQQTTMLRYQRIGAFEQLNAQKALSNPFVMSQMSDSQIRDAKFRADGTFNRMIDHKIAEVNRRCYVQQLR